jgi:hypothetical protein
MDQGKGARLKREVSRSTKLPAFQLDLGALEVLCERIQALFDASKVYTKIEIPLKGETLKFDTVEEIRQYKDLRGTARNFSLWFSEGDRSVRISCSGIFRSDASVSASGATEAWCAGAIETVNSFLRYHKVWYHWFRTLPFGWFLFGALNLPNIFIWGRIAKLNLAVTTMSLYGWVSAILVLALLYFGRDRLLPPVGVIITEEENIWRRRTPELSLLLALAAVVLTVIGWFVGK